MTWVQQDVVQICRFASFLNFFKMRSFLSMYGVSKTNKILRESRKTIRNGPV